MKKDLFNLRLRSRWLLVSLLALLAGTSPAWADTLTENFDEVKRLDASGNEITSNYTYGYSLSNGWLVSPAAGVISASNSYHYGIATGGNTGNALWAGYGASQSYYLVIPTQIVGEVKFKAKKTSSNSSTKGYISLYEVTESGGIYTVTSTKLGSTVEPTTNSAWNDYSINIGEEGKYVALHMIRSGLDDFEATIYEETGCKKPKSLTVSDPTFTTANLSWTAGEEGQDTWQVVYSTDANFDKDAAAKTDVNTTAYQLTGLSDNTTYYIAVRSYCDSENQSAWATTSFTTPLAPISSFPWTENFNSLTSGIPSGWDNADGTTTSASYKWSYYASGHDGTGLRFDSYSNYTNSTNFLKTPTLDFTAGNPMQLVFWYKNPKGGDFSVYISEDGGATYTTELATGLTGATDWTEIKRDIPAEFVGKSNVVIVFKGTSNYGTGDAYIYLDDVTVKENAAYAWSVSGSDVVSNTIAFGTVKNNSTTKTFTITNDGASTLSGVTVTSSDNTVFTVSDTNFDIEAGATKDITVTFIKEVVGDYSESITVSQANVDNIVLTATATYETPAVAQMAVKFGEDAVGETVAFGNVGKSIAKTFTIANDGEATLNISSIVSSNANFIVSPATLAVEGGKTGTFTVTFVYDAENLGTEKSANITITPSNEGLSPVTFAVTATSIEQWSEDFSGNALPEGWERTSTTYWTFADEVAKSSNNTQTNYYLITPSLKVEDGASLSFDVLATSSYATLTIEKQKNNGTWESCKTIQQGSTYDIKALNTWETFTITADELGSTGNYKFRFNARGFWLDNFQGFKLNNDDPKFGIYTNPGCTTAAAASETVNFGFVTTAPDAQIYYLKNDNTGTLTLTLGDVPTGFTAVLGKNSLGKGESTTLTINMPVETKGYRGGNIVVTAKNSSDVALGTFTVAASGVAIDDNKLNLNFETDNIPSTWTANDWMKDASGYIKTGQSGYSNTSMVTSTLTAEAGEQLIFVAKNGNTSSTYNFGVKYKKAGDAEWSDLIASANIGTSWTTLVGTIAEAGDYLFQINGYYASIQRIYGLTANTAPAMVIYDGAAQVASSHDFGLVTDENDVIWTLTVKNEGDGKLTGLAAALTGTNADHYTAVITGATGENNDEIAAGAEATITVTQLKDNLGSHSATLTISADGLDSKVITLSGSTRDHTKLYVDFANNAFPEGWTVGANWAVTSGYAYQSSSSTPTAFVTTPLTVAENETLTFKVKKYGNGNKLLQIRYSQNGGVTWSDYVEYYNTDQATSSYTEKEVTDIPTGNIILEFYGNNIIIDDIQGFSLATAPALALTEGGAAVANGNTKAFGKLSADGVATYTLKNIGNANMESTVTTTGEATVAISGEGEGVTIVNNTVTLAAGKSATVTLTVPYTTSYGEKSGVMTIATEGWVGDMVVNYTATTIDPDAINVDFAEGRPAGWYAETGQTTMTGWVFSNGDARVSTSVDKTMITEMYGAAEGKNVLSFEAKAYSGSEQTLKVSTSTDRKTWSEPQTFTLTSDYQTISLNELANGSYYVKFVATNATIDNLSGLKKLTAPEHDLYVSTSTFPTKTLLPETENGLTASATVYSLRAAETGVYAKLFLDEEAIATTDAQDISLNGSATFNFTCNVPATEKTYATKIVVYYSNDEVAFETLATDITVSETRTLQITNFARTSEATVDADASNQFTSTFNVTVKNNGTIAQDAANVSVSITDADGNVLNGNATSWTAANSQTIFVTPGDYATADAVLALYSWGKAESWSRLTETNIAGFYSGELNGNTNFRIVRLKPSTAEDYNAENNGLNDANIWNRSTDMATSDGNVFTFKGWADKNDDGYHWFTYGTMAQLAVGVSTTMSVSMTTSALEGGVFTFKAKENLSNTVSSASANVTVNAAAPKFELALGSEAIEDGDAVAYGIVREATTKTFTITNAGSAPLLINSINVPEGFTYSDGENSDWSIYLYNGNDIDGDAGIFKKTATEGVFVLNNLVITGDAGFEIHTSDWSEKYAELTEDAPDITELGTRTLESGQKYKWLKLPAGTYGAVWNYNTKELTFREAGIPAGETADVKVTLQAEQGKVSGNLTFTYKVDATTNNTFNVALSGRSIDEDTWSEDFATEIPSTWQNGINNNKWAWDEDKQIAYSQGYTDERVLTTPGLEAKKDDLLTYDLSFRYSGYTMKVQYSNDYKTWTDYATLGYEDAGEQSFVAPTDGIYFLRFIASRYAELDNFVGFKAAYTLDEKLAAEVVAECEDKSLVLNRTFVAGWNTVCLPFDVTNTEDVFGTGAQVYDFTGYENGELQFTKVTTDLEAAKPYVVYVANAITNPIVLNNIAISETAANEASSTTWNGATFQGTYAPMAAGTMTGKYGVTTEAKIAKGSDKASMKGFRAYFEQLPQGAAARIAFFDENGNSTKIGTIAAEKAEGQIFNLQGQRVENLKKDNLYIINGKKVVIK